jgi:hypothetical protein
MYRLVLLTFAFFYENTMTTIVNTMTTIVTYNRLGGAVPGPASHGRRHRPLAVDPHLHHLHQSQPTV